MIRAIACPPYTAEEIETMLDEEEQEWGPQEADLAEQSSTFLTKYEALVVTLGAPGVCLIVLSFALQFVGVLIHKAGT